MHGRLVFALAALAALAFPAAASAGPAEDFAAVFEDWRADGQVSACHWTQPQLENTVFIIGFVSDLAYSDFPAEVARELGRQKQGRCAAAGPETPAGDQAPGVAAPAQPPSPAARAQSPIGTLRIMRVGIRGNASREYVRIANSGRRTARLAGATIRNGRRERLRLPRNLTVRAGRAITVHVRCAQGSRRAVVRGSHVYACSSRRSLFADRGDVAQLADSRGRVISQRGSGRRGGVPRF